MCQLLYLVKVRHVRILCGGQSICRVFQHCLKLIFSLWQYCSFIIIFCKFQFLVCNLRNVTAISIDRTNVHNFMNPWNCTVYKINPWKIMCFVIYTQVIYLLTFRGSLFMSIKWTCMIINHLMRFHQIKSFLSIITKNIDQTEMKYL